MLECNRMSLSLLIVLTPLGASRSKMPFRMQAAAKRAATCMSEPPKRFRVAPPSAAALKDLDLPKRTAPQTIPSSATMTAVIYKVSDCAGDSVSGYAGVHAGLFEVMMDHAAYPSILYRTRFEFDDFLRNAHHTAADAPANLEELDAMAGQLSIVLATVLYVTEPMLASQGSCCTKPPRTTQMRRATQPFRRDGRS